MPQNKKSTADYKGHDLSTEELYQRAFEEEVERKAPRDNIQPLEVLTEDQKEEFFQIRDQLTEMGIINNLDSYTLNSYIQTKYLYQEALENMKREPQNEKQAQILNKLFSQFKVLSDQLGLNPNGRFKLPKIGVSKKENKFAQFMNF